MHRWLVVIAVAALAACSNDTVGNNVNNNDASPSDLSTPDLGGGDVASDVDQPPDEDARESDCLQVSMNLDTFRVSLADDVAIEYSGTLEPDIFGQERELSLLFERYNESEFVGTFELGTAPDDNFGNCHHCLFVRGNSVERAFFADEGTLVSNSDPYSRRGDFEVSGLKLIEVAVDPFTRESAPLADGRCIEIADFEASGVFPVAGWTCPTEQFADNAECNCECGAYDPDCGGEITCLPGDPACTPRPALPTEGCEAEQVCAFEPISMGTSCTDTCDWAAREGCDSGTCVFEFGVGEGDLCIADGPRILPDVALGDACPLGNLQGFCNVVDGFAEGYCGPNYVCRPLCEDDAECPVEDETCRVFSNLSPLGYCGPEPVDPDGM